MLSSRSSQTGDAADGYVDRPGPPSARTHGAGQHNPEGDIPSPDLYSRPADSDPNYTPDCDEPVNPPRQSIHDVHPPCEASQPHTAAKRVVFRASSAEPGRIAKSPAASSSGGGALCVTDVQPVAHELAISAPVVDDGSPVPLV